MNKIGQLMGSLLRTRGKKLANVCLVLGIGAGAFFLRDREIFDVIRRYRTNTVVTEPTEPLNKFDEAFILPCRARVHFGVLAGPDGAAKTTFIKGVMAKHKTLPIKYAEVPAYGTCEERVKEALREAFKLRSKRARGEVHKFAAALSLTLESAKDFQNRNPKQPQVAIFDKVENLIGCDTEVGHMLHVAKVTASNHTVTMVFVANTPQAEEMLRRNGDKTRLATRTFGDTAEY